MEASPPRLHPQWSDASIPYATTSGRLNRGVGSARGGPGTAQAHSQPGSPVSVRANDTNWYVVTGGPSSGKTTTVNLLRERGYRTTIEHARHFIDTQRITGRTVAEIRANQSAFQRAVLDMQIEQERSIERNELYFLDRALPDTLAYYRFLNLAPEPALTEALAQVVYKKAFVLDLLPLVSDYARTEDRDAQQRIHDLIVEAYDSLKIPTVHVPVLLAAARVDFILERL